MKRPDYGYVKFSLIGTDCEEFISSAMEDEIKIYDIENIDKIIYCKVSPSDYIRLFKKRRKYTVRMRIEEKKGIRFKLYKYRNRYGILIGMLSYGIILILCSGIVWDITITGNNNISDESIIDFLAENGIYAGASRKDLQLTVAELKAMLYFDDLSWISIENEGSRVNVKISERIINSDTGLPAGTPCNIVASRGGIIKEAEVYRGTMLYEIGSGVAAGDVIVSGIVNDGAGHISVNHADAKIVAEFEEEVSFYQEFKTYEQKNTDETYTKEYIKLFGFTFPHNINEYLDGYTYTSENYEVKFFGIKMPWTRTVVTGTKNETIEVTRTVNDVKRLLEQKLELYEMNLLKDLTVVDRDIEYQRDEKGIKLICKYTLQGNIAKQSEIFYRNEE